MTGATLPSRWQTRLATLSSPLVALAAAIAVVAFGYRALRSAYRPQGYDQTAYIEGTRALWRGLDPYTTDPTFHYLYPPPFALLMSPFAALPTWLLVVIWTAALALVVFLVGRFAIREFAAVRPDRVPLPVAWIAALTALVMFRPLHANFVNGQVNLFLVGFAVAFAVDLRARREARAGLWLALAIAIKITPAVFGAFLLVRWDWRTIGWTAAWALLLAIAPAAVVGPADLLGLWQSFWIEVVVEFRRWTGPYYIAPNGEPIFFTLWGLFHFVSPQLGEIRAVGHAANAVAVGLAITGHLVLDARSRTDGRDRSGFVVALYLLAILLVGPMAQKHHLALLLPAAVFATLSAFARGRRDRLAIAAWLVVTTSLLGSKLWQDGPLFVVAILASGVAVMRSARIDPRAGGGTTQPAVGRPGSGPPAPMPRPG